MSECEWVFLIESLARIDDEEAGGREERRNKSTEAALAKPDRLTRRGEARRRGVWRKQGSSRGQGEEVDCGYTVSVCEKRDRAWCDDSTRWRVDKRHE